MSCLTRFGTVATRVRGLVAIATATATATATGTMGATHSERT